MAELSSMRPQTAYEISLAYDVLPILKMAGWVALAAKSNGEIHTARRLYPAFDKAYKGAFDEKQIAPIDDSVPLLADVLQVTARLLEVVTDAHGGDL